MYTNFANLQQTMLLQQRMFLQALCQPNAIVKNANPPNNTATVDASKKHFIAPSLSQYRFVSGQQVKFHRFFLIKSMKMLQTAKNDTIALQQKKRRIALKAH